MVDRFPVWSIEAALSASGRRLVVLLPLIFPAFAALAAGPLAQHLEPRLATWLLTAAGAVLAAASSAVLGLLVLAGLIRIPLVAALGDLSLPVVRRGDPPTRSVALIAGLLLTAAAVAAARMLRRRIRALVSAATEAACMPGRDQLVVIDDPAAEAFAMPGLPGRIVVSTGMLAALDSTEHDVLLAHERAHLSGHHYLFVALAELAAAANPLLRPVAASVTYTVERWADEHAAATTGDRRRVARVVGKAALAAKYTRAQRLIPAAALGALGRHRARRAAGGPVPRRVAALLAPPPRNRPLPLIATTAVVAAAGLSALEAAHDLHRLLELASYR